MGRLAGLQQAQFSGSILRHQNHTVRKNTLQFARSEIHQDEHLLSDQLFGREMFGDSRNYLAFVDTRISNFFVLATFSAARIVETRISIF